MRPLSPSRGKAAMESLDPPTPEWRDHPTYYHQEMILRDYLATDRTAMSNEQSLLSYIRTALALAAGGGTLMHLQVDAFIRIAGGMLLGSSILLMVVGIRRFRHVQGMLRRVRQTSRPKRIPREGDHSLPSRTT